MSVLQLAAEKKTSFLVGTSNKFRSFLFCQNFSYSSMTKHDVCDLSFTSRKSCIFLFAFLFSETNLFDEVSSEWHERGGHTVLKSFLKHTINILYPWSTRYVFDLSLSSNMIKTNIKKVRTRMFFQNLFQSITIVVNAFYGAAF